MEPVASAHTRWTLMHYAPWVLPRHDTARQQVETLLRQQHEMLTITLRSIADGVLTTDPHGRITFLNPVAETLTVTLAP